MMPLDREALDEAEFERKLFASARADGAPTDVVEAWKRFAGAVSPVVLDPELGGGAGRPRETAVVSKASVSVDRAGAMKWMALGAIAGSVVTAAVLLRLPRARVATPAGVVWREETVAVPLKTGDGARRPSADAVLKPDPTPPVRALLAPHPRHAGPGRTRTLPDRDGLVGAELIPHGSSTLAEEVSRLDAARTSNAAGDYDATILLMERYHQDFPDGALAPDAEVVALEAVAAKRDHVETARRAARFLARYPGDPHAARVRELAIASRARGR